MIATTANALRQNSFHKFRRIVAQDSGEAQSSALYRFTMAPSGISLEDRIEKLLEFEAENGHMFVPFHYKEKNGLGRFVSNARQLRKSGKMTQEVIAKLDEVGFVWVIPKGPAKDELIEWGKQFRWLVNFHKAKGHCNVPAKIGGKVVPAAAWCEEQRQLHLSGKLDMGKFDKLSKFGFDFYGSSEEDNEDQPVSQ